jgi:uncharacterized protein (TIGR02145 family)
MRIKKYIVFVLGIALLKCSQPSKPDTNTVDYTIHLTGRVLEKDGKPIPNTIAKLVGKDLSDTTDANGYYQIIEKTSTLSLNKKLAGDTLDSLQIIKDGQVITMLDIANWIDTLPDVFVIQRDIYGNLTSKPDSLCVIKALITGDNIPDSIPNLAELWYNTLNQSYSGFVYFIYSTKLTHYSVYVNVYKKDTVFIGRSVKVDFPSTAGNINIPSFSPNNAEPVLNAGSDTTVSIHDTIRLQPIAIDSFGGKISKWEWDIGNTGKFIETTPETNFITIAPSTADSNYRCVLRVMDDDSNIVSDTVIIDVIRDAPVPKAHAREPIVSLNDSIHLSGTATQQFGRIIKWEWDVGNTGIFIEKTPDSNFNTIAPLNLDSILKCVLRVTDDDSNVVCDTIGICGLVKDADNNIYSTVKIGDQYWTVENLRTTKFNDGTPIPLVSVDSVWVTLSTPGYCFYNNTTNVDSINKFGALYNCYAVDAKKLAPAGWHIPTDDDWNMLINFLIANGYNWDGTISDPSSSGAKLAKSLAATTDWSLNSFPGAIGNDLSKNNKSHFAALPSGIRFEKGFWGIGITGRWWSSTIENVEPRSAFFRSLYTEDAGVSYTCAPLICGYSVRLIKNK